MGRCGQAHLAKWVELVCRKGWWYKYLCREHSGKMGKEGTDAAARGVSRGLRVGGSLCQHRECGTDA